MNVGHTTVTGRNMKDRLGKILAKWRVETVLPHIKGRLLDIGCGTNLLVRNYTGKGTGADVHDWGDVDLLVGDTSALPVDNGSFDTVTILAALNHIPNRADVLREAHRILSPSGRIVVTMIPPRISQIWHFLRQPWDVDQHERGMVAGELYGLTARQVRELLNSAGFTIVHEERFMLWINYLVVAEKR